MQFHVVDLDRAAPRERTVSITSDDGPVRSVLWVPVPTWADPDYLDNALVDDTDRLALRSDVTVLGLPPEVATHDDLFDDVYRRLGKPLYVVSHSSMVPTITRVRGDAPFDDSQLPAFLDAIRQVDVEAVVRKAGAELPPHDTLHYEGPNGSHYSAFMRVGMALRSTAELDRVAFWLVEHLADRTCLVVDHWALIALGYRVGNYRVRLGCDPAPFAVEAVTSYDEPVESLARRLELSFQGFGPDDLGVIISVNSSNQLADRIRIAAHMADHADVVSIAVCQTPDDGDERIPALATLPNIFQRHDDGECGDCATNASIIVPIQHDTYLLELAAYVRQVAIKVATAAAGRSFFERYPDPGIASVHRYHGDGRHHAFHIDIGALAQRSSFTDKLAELVKRWEGSNIDLVICPSHEPARTMAAIVADVLGCPWVTVDEKRLRDLTGGERELCLSAKRLCVVDDAVITGARLYGYRNELIRWRREADGASSEFDMFACIGVARPESSMDLRGIMDVTHHTEGDPRFFAVETLVLPNWDRDECPWCDEYVRLGEFAAQLAAPSAPIEERLNRLAARHGLTDNLFLRWTGGPWLDEAPGAEEEWDAAASSDDEFERDAELDRRLAALKGDYFELNPKSVFGEVQQAELMISVAAAIQQLRDRRYDNGTLVEPELDEVFRSPVAKILDPALYLTGRFYEPVLIASIMRAVRRHDVRAPMKEATLAAAVTGHLLTRPSSIELRMELLFHAARGVLPRVAVDVTTIDPPPADELADLAAELSRQASRRIPV